MELTRRQAMAGAAAGALLPLIMAGAVQAQAAGAADTTRILTCRFGS